MLKQILKHKLGKPWKLNKNSVVAVVPILHEEPIPQREYILVQETKDVEITDTGAIDKAKVRNKTNKHVFLRKGTLLKGATQERGVVIGRIIAPQKTETIKVQCVHASKGIHSGAVFFASEHIAPRPVMKSFLSQRSQSVTWSAANKSNKMLMSMADTPHVASHRVDDLVGTLERTTKFKDEIEEALKQIPADITNQIGIVIVDIRGVVGIELFNHPDSWRAFSKSITRNYADLITKESEKSLFTINMEKVDSAVTEFLTEISNIPSKLVAETTYIIENNRVVGEYTTLKNEIIHLVVARKEKEDKFRESYNPRPIPRIFSMRERNTGLSTPRTTENISPFVSTVAIQNFLERKESHSLLKRLNKEPATWTMLGESVDLSERTLARRLKTGEYLGLLEQQAYGNGRRRYTLTKKGKKLLYNEG